MLVTEWAEFAELDWEAMAAPMAVRDVDGRNFLDPGEMRSGLHL